MATDSTGQIVFVNHLAEELFGYPRAEIVGQPVQSIWPERFRDRYSRNMQLYFRTEDPLRFSTEAWGLRKDGSEFVGEMSWGVVHTTAGPLLLAIGRDVTERRLIESRRRAVARLGARALHGADAQHLAYEAVEMLLTNLPIAGAALRRADGTTLAAEGRAAEDGLRLEVGAGDRLYVAPDRELIDEELGVVFAITNTLSVALNRLRGDAEVRWEALHDPLTGVANRTLLDDHLNQALARASRSGQSIAVLFVDLDGFKTVNDVHGHDAGDAVLIEIGRRLRTALRPGDTLARFGGDEFVAVCDDLDPPTSVRIAERMLSAVAEPISVAGAAIQLTASVGIALGHADAQAMLKAADTATYHAKHAGRARFSLTICPEPRG